MRIKILKATKDDVVNGKKLPKAPWYHKYIGKEFDVLKDKPKGTYQDKPAYRVDVALVPE